MFNRKNTKTYRFPQYMFQISKLYIFSTFFFIDIVKNILINFLNLNYESLFWFWLVNIEVNIMYWMIQLIFSYHRLNPVIDLH